MREKITPRLKSAAVGLSFGLIIFLVLGILTVLIPTPLYLRMSAIHYYDYIFLILTSVLMGIYVGLWHYKRKTRKYCQYSAIGGTFGGVFAFGCAICNKILILLLGFTGVMTYFMPLQPPLGVASLGLSSYGVYQQGKLS